jgi:nicotinate-nucleotide adenylyltransferase
MNEGSRGSRVGFFGGSFDPPHLGHLTVARAARDALALDEVLFAPVGSQPLKLHGAMASFEDRAAMTELAIAGEPGFSLSLADAPKPSGEPNFTLETLLSVRTTFPPESALFCIMGADSFVSLRRWHRAAEIPFVAPLIVASRPGEPLGDLEALLPAGLHTESGKALENSSAVEVRAYTLVNTSGDRTPFYVLPGLDVEISASKIRAAIRAPGSRETETAGAERGLLPDAVLHYIRAHGLYS